MQRSVLTILLLAALAVPTAGQQVLKPVEPADSRTPESVSAQTVIHVTDVLNATPEAKRWLQEFHDAKRNGLLPYAAKAQRVYGVGDTVTFRVLNLQNNVWGDKRFIFRAESSTANIYVAVDQPHVTNTDVQMLNDALNVSTPPNSINPASGLIANNNAVFGDAPNVDGDGVVDVLLYDIIDGISGGFVAGFVNSADLSLSGPGNRRDVVHIDSNEGILQRTLPDMFSTVAHEHQHLIHFNFDTSEESFVNEGLSEYAEIMNGYEGRFITYLSEPSLRNASLLRWVDTPTDGFADRQRGALFTTFVAEQTSPFTAGNITKNTSRGITGYRNVLEAAGTTLEDVVLNFQSATLLNGSGLTSDPRFEFSSATYSAVKLSGPDLIVDGRTNSQTVRRDTVKGGGARFYVWNDVEDFMLTANPFVEGGQTEPLTLGRSRPRVIIERASAAPEIIDLDPRVIDVSFSGQIDRITLQLTHVKPVSSGAEFSTSNRLIYDIDARWSGSTATTVTTVYDNGQPDTSLDPAFFGLGPTQRFATRFVIEEPSRTSLDIASVAIYYNNQFLNGPPDTSPRDFTLHVWADSMGLPGAELFSKPITDPRPNEDVFQGEPLRFLDVDLSDDNIPDLPGVIHIGVANFGTDSNIAVFTFSRYIAENVSSILLDSGWSEVWDLSVGDPPESLVNRMIPIRLQVLVQPEIVAVEEDAELPDEISLAQNYPNPFNPTTSISYALPRAAHVKLVVYDILGRQVATLLNEARPAGQHTLTVDAGAWASGMYIYTLEAEGKSVTRNMVLLR